MQKLVIRLLPLVLVTLCFLDCSNIGDNPQIENKTNQNQINKTCKLPSGQTVEDGFSGKDSGNNYCNYCDCSNGEYRCTEMFCNLDKADE